MKITIDVKYGETVGAILKKVVAASGDALLENEEFGCMCSGGDCQRKDIKMCKLVELDCCLKGNSTCFYLKMPEDLLMRRFYKCLLLNTRLYQNDDGSIDPCEECMMAGKPLE